MAKRIPIDHRTDIYSLGATPTKPSPGGLRSRGGTSSDLSMIVLDDPEPLRKRKPADPEGPRDDRPQVLRKSPADRYGTAEALAQDLRRFVRGTPIEARPQSRWEKLARKRCRHRIA